MGKKLAAARRDINVLLARGTVRPFSSSWVSPLHMIPTGEHDWKTSGDYRGFNQITVPDAYPIPRIEDLRMSLKSCTIFTKLNMQRAYQLRVAPEDVPKTAIIIPFGLLEFVGILFGLCDPDQTFQRHMNLLFRHLPCAKVYIDDILKCSTTLDEHLQHFAAVLKALQTQVYTQQEEVRLRSKFSHFSWVSHLLTSFYAL